MDNLAKSHGFKRFLEIIPGGLAWSTLLFPIILAPFFPIAVAYFILIFNLYWLFKSINLSKHLTKGYLKLKRNMKTDWLHRCKNLKNPDRLISWYEVNALYPEEKADLKKLKRIKNEKIKIEDWENIYHVAVIAISIEGLDILKPTLEAIKDSNYPNDKIYIVLAVEE